MGLIKRAWSFLATSTAYIVLKQVIVCASVASRPCSLRLLSAGKRIQEEARLQLLHRLESPVTNPLPGHTRLETTAGGQV